MKETGVGRQRVVHDRPGRLHQVALARVLHVLRPCKILRVLHQRAVGLKDDGATVLQKKCGQHSMDATAPRHARASGSRLRPPPPQKKKKKLPHQLLQDEKFSLCDIVGGAGVGQLLKLAVLGPPALKVRFDDMLAALHQHRVGGAPRVEIDDAALFHLGWVAGKGGEGSSASGGCHRQAKRATRPSLAAPTL